MSDRQIRNCFINAELQNHYKIIYILKQYYIDDYKVWNTYVVRKLLLSWCCNAIKKCFFLQIAFPSLAIFFVVDLMCCCECFIMPYHASKSLCFLFWWLNTWLMISIRKTQYIIIVFGHVNLWKQTLIECCLPSNNLYLNMFLDI